ncbi:hypothetical protein SprV_0100242100 [Sparganum proliferum]
MDAGHTFFWSGRPKAERRDAGVAFAIWKDIVGRLPCSPHDTNNRLMSLRLHLRERKFVTNVSVYANPPPLRPQRPVRTRTPAHPAQHQLPPPYAREGHLDAPSVATVAPAGQCPHPQARPMRRASDKGDLGCRRVGRQSPHHLQDEDSPTASQETSSSEIAQRLAKLPVAAVAADENASLENRWCQLRDTVQSTTLSVLGRVRRQHQDGVDDIDTAISNLLTEENLLRLLLQQCAEQFGDVLNRPSTISDAAIPRPPQTEINVNLDLPPSLHETIRTVKQLSSGKASGSDAILPEIYKHGGSQIIDHLTTLSQEMWRHIEVPQDLKDAKIVHLYKRKGNRQICDISRSISLLNIAGKIFACVLLNCLNHHLEQGLLTKSRCGFGRHCGTTDIILAAWQLQNKCQEMRIYLFSIFVRLAKAVNRGESRRTVMLRQLHDGIMARVTDNGTVSEAFAVTNGMKQGCVLASTFFSLMFSSMLMDAYREERLGIRVVYRTDGQLLNQWLMHFQSRVSTTSVHGLPFADDCALNITSEGDMQRGMDLLAAACDNFGLIIPPTLTRANL